MKKYVVLFTLFLVPLIFYIFLSKGIYKYSNLPILTNHVLDVKADFISNGTCSFENKISIVSFLGTDLKMAKASLFNINQIVYKRYFSKPYFQAVAILPEESKNEYEAVIEELAAFTDVSKWHFLYLNSASIKKLFNSFETPYQLNESLQCDYAFIIDKKLRLRGRKDDKDSTDGKLYGYHMRSVTTLKDKLKDDIDIIYYQLKKSAEKEKRYLREHQND